VVRIFNRSVSHAAMDEMDVWWSLRASGCVRVALSLRPTIISTAASVIGRGQTFPPSDFDSEIYLSIHPSIYPSLGKGEGVRDDFTPRHFAV